MATELLTHAKTGVIQMGWPKLYEAVAFKGNKDDDKSAKKDDKKKNESTPAYGFPVLLDKDDPDHMRTVRILQKLSKNAEANAIALKKWGKKDRIVSNDGLKDADEDEILDGDKTVLMTDKYPNRANHFYVNFSRSSKAGRPGIRYIDDEGILRELPEPILGTKEDIQAAQANLNDARAAYATADEDAREEAKTLVLEATRNLEEAQERDAKAKEVKVLWDKLVYPGQNVQASVTARAWKTQTGSGVSYRLDNLTIVGGGVRDGSFEYDEDFTDEDIEALIAWRDKHVNAKPSKADDEAALLADTDFDEADSDDEVDEDTGEIAVKPRRKAAVSRRRPKPVEVEDDDVDEDEDEEEAPRHRPKKTSSRGRRKPAPVEVEDDDVDDEDYPRHVLMYGINGKAEVNCLGFPFFQPTLPPLLPLVASLLRLRDTLPHCCRLIRRLIHQSSHIPRPSSTCSRMDSAEAAAPAAAPVGLGPVVPLPLLPWPLPRLSSSRPHPSWLYPLWR